MRLVEGDLNKMGFSASVTFETHLEQYIKIIKEDDKYHHLVI